MYTEQVLNHFNNPRNVGEIKKANAIGTSRDNQGNIVKIWLTVTNAKIKEIAFKSNGCVPTIAAASILTTIIKNKSVDKAEKTKTNNIIKALGGLPKSKYRCAQAALDALKNALEIYKENNST